MADQQPNEMQPPVEGQNEKVTFDERQQAKLDSLIKEAQGRAARELRAERDKLLSDLEVTRAELRLNQASNTPELNEARAKLAEETQKRTEAESALHAARKNAALTDALTKLDCLNVSDAAALLRDSIKWEGDSLAGLDGKPLEAVVNAFLQERPYLVRGSVRRGAGSAEATGPLNNGKHKVEDIFGPKSSSKLANQLAMTNRKEYDRLRAIAKSQGLL